MTTTSGSHAADPLTGPASWQLEQDGSSATIQHKAIWGLVTVRGTFTGIRGAGEVHADGSAGGLIEIDAASIDTRNAKRDAHLRSADFFNAEVHPRIVAELGPVTRLDHETATVAGTLTVNGIARPVHLTATISEASSEATTLRAEAEIDRADFGMTWNQLGMIKGKAAVTVVARFVRPTAG